MAIALVDHTEFSGDVNGGTAAGINTTGASIIVISLCYYFARVSGPTVTDSNGNTYTALTEYNNSTASAQRLYYCASPVVGSGHTFTVSGSGIFCSFYVSAFSGTAASPFDVENGAGTSSFSSSLQPGSVTPSAANSLIVSGLTIEGTPILAIDSGFSITDQSPYLPGMTYGGALAYLIQGAASPVNPTWSITGGANATASIAVFGQASAPSGGDAPSNLSGNITGNLTGGYSG